MQYNIRWKAVPGYKGLYEVSELGQVRTKPKPGRMRGEIISPFLRRGYLWVELWKNGKEQVYTLHRITALAFMKEDKDRPYINHKNGIKYDNRLENLEWCTTHENNLHARNVGLSNKAYPQKYPDPAIPPAYNQQLKIVQFTIDKIPVAVFASMKDAAKSVCVFPSTLRKSVINPNYVCQGFYWRVYAGEPLQWTQASAGANDERRMTSIFGAPF